MIKRFIKWGIYSQLLLRIFEKYICTGNNCEKCKCKYIDVNELPKCALVSVVEQFKEERE